MRDDEPVAQDESAPDRSSPDSSVEPAGSGPGWWSHPNELRKIGDEPDYRFSLANERTFLAWVRTALALLAGGVAVVQIVPAFSVPGGRHVLGIPLVLLSIVLSLSSYRHWAAAEHALRLGRPLPPSTLPRVLGAGVALVSLAALVMIIIGTFRPPA